MKVTLNGQTVDLRDAYGNEVEPFTINGTTYLPVASIGKALGLNVSWDNSTKTVILTTSSESQSTGTSGGAVNAGSYLGEGQSQGDCPEPRRVSPPLRLPSSGANLSTTTAGPCTMWISGAETRSTTTRSTPSPGPSSATTLTLKGMSPVPPAARSPAPTIGAGKAKTIALNHAGVSASNAVFLHAKLDYDDGRRTYEVEFYSGSKEYDYEIDAAPERF